MRRTYPAVFMLALTLVLLAGSAVSSQPKQAGDQKPTVVVASDLHGNDLLRLCSSELTSELGFCIGYIEGIRDGVVFEAVGHNAKPLFAISDKVTSEQLKDVVVKWLKQNPETRHKPAGMLTIFALEAAFPPESPK
jgi:hypothetical protein